MARAKKEVYVQKAVTTGISADVKMTIKIRDNYYSVNAHEDRTVPDSPDVNLHKEWVLLYNSVYDECVERLGEIKEALGRKK